MKKSVLVLLVLAVISFAIMGCSKKEESAQQGETVTPVVEESSAPVESTPVESAQPSESAPQTETPPADQNEVQGTEVPEEVAPAATDGGVDAG